MSEKDGGSVFPQIQQEAFEGGGSSLSILGGISLRDYLAAAALTGLMSNGNDWPTRDQIKPAAQAAYLIADALLKARTQGES